MMIEAQCSESKEIYRIALFIMYKPQHYIMV